MDMIINESPIQGDFSLLVTLSLSNNANLPSVLIALPPSYGRYFPLYNPLELSSPYTCSSSKPSLEYLSHQTSSSGFSELISQEILFRGLLHINAAIKVGKMHLMWW